jgi:sulfur carrier protein
MTIVLNGERVELHDGASVADAVIQVGHLAEAAGVAVAVDGEVVPRSSWESTELRAGQLVEIVGAVQGG